MNEQTPAPEQERWPVIVTTRDGQEQEGVVEALGLLHHMITDDGLGWLVIECPDGMRAFATRHIISVAMTEKTPQDIDEALDALRKARR